MRTTTGLRFEASVEAVGSSASVASNLAFYAASSFPSSSSSEERRIGKLAPRHYSGSSDYPTPSFWLAQLTTQREPQEEIGGLATQFERVGCCAPNGRHGSRRDMNQ